MSYKAYVRSSASRLSIAQILSSKPSVLLGVDDGVETLLRDLQIQTVFDLGMSTVFDNAARIASAGDRVDSEFRRFGRAPASVVDGDLVTTTEVTALPYQDIEALIGIGPQIAPQMVSKLAVERIRDLAMWPPYLAAKTIVIQAYNPTTALDVDPEAPAELVPTGGTFGTERFLYSSVVMSEGSSLPANAPILNQRRFDITTTPTTSFDKVRFGARLTYAQSWIPKQLSRGHLLHSLPLAPGESTSVAVVDWTNKVAAATQQSVSESEKIESVSDQTRTIGQIAEAVAKEVQTGSSQSGSQSTSLSTWQTGGEIPLPLIIASQGANQTTAATHTVSTGDRSIDSHLRQNIQGSTHQVSGSVRGQRAAVVTEVSQRESEHLSTRSITNYNHMHALTIQYYEVVQLYETQLRLHDVERCIFIPMKLVDFRDERNIFRYLTRLRVAALDETTRSALDELADTRQSNALTFEPRSPALIPPDPAWLTSIGVTATGPLLPMFVNGARNRLTSWRSEMRFTARQLEGRGLLESSDEGLPPQTVGLPFGLQLRNLDWSPPIARVRVQMENGEIHTFQPHPSDDASAIHDDMPNDLPLSFGAIERILLEIQPGFHPQSPSELSVKLRLGVGLGDETGWLDAGFFLVRPASEYDGEYMRVTTPDGVEQVADLLMEHQLYYSQQIWMHENPQTLIMQLAPYRLNIEGVDVTLVDHIAPMPVAVVGNYVVYRFTYDRDDAWKQWLRANVDWSSMEADEVPVPTGGVFAEAVLGRSNSAEKIDLTRFFNWKDSPPPAPPQIAALQAGTRKGSSTPELPSVDAPLVSIQNPIAFPDAGGFSSVLSALTTAELFRNMSGAAATGAAATQAVEASSANSIGSMTAIADIYTSMLNTVAKAVEKMPTADGLKTLSEIGSLFSDPLKKLAEGAAKGITKEIADQIRREVDDALKRTPFGDRDGERAPGNNAPGRDPAGTTTIDATAAGVVPTPQVSTAVGDEVTRPMLALLSAYVSQPENFKYLPPGVSTLFARGGVQGLGLLVRHDLLEAFLRTGTPATIDAIYDAAYERAGVHGVASLVAHNVMRTLTRGGTFDKMALPWERNACGGPPETDSRWVSYLAGVPEASSRGDATMKKFTYTFVQGTTPDNKFLRKTDECPCTPEADNLCSSGFYQLFDQTFGLDDPGDWYHYFLTHTIATYFTSDQISTDFTDWWDVATGEIEGTAEQREYVLFIYVALLGVREVLRRYHDRVNHPVVTPETERIYDGWLWANALSILEEVGYGETGKSDSQAATSRESAVHRRGSADGIKRVNPSFDTSPPNWRWIVPKANNLVKRIGPPILALVRDWGGLNAVEAALRLYELANILEPELGPFENYIHDTLDFRGLSVSAQPPAPPRDALVRGQHVPATSELAASGAFVARILPGTPEHDALVFTASPFLVFANGDPSRYRMTPKLRDNLELLAELVATAFPGFKLRVTSAWRETPPQPPARSLHHEGRAIDMNVIQDDATIIAAGQHDPSKLGRLAQLAVDVGFSWVWYEDDGHVHASVEH